MNEFLEGVGDEFDAKPGGSQANPPHRILFVEETANYPKLQPVLLAQPKKHMTPTRLVQGTLPAAMHPLTPAYFAHPQALVEEGVSIGQRTRIWAFAHVASGAVIGEDCNICDHTFIEGRVRIGNRVTIKCGVYLWDGLTVEDDVFIGPSAVFTNDVRPRSKRYLSHPFTNVLKEGCSLGAGSITLPGITIGRWAMVGAGSVVTHDLPDHALAVGNPARWRAWVCQCGEKLFPTSGRFLGCKCGRSYEQMTANEVKETDGRHLNLPESNGFADSSEPVSENNGHHASNVQTTRVGL